MKKWLLSIAVLSGAGLMAGCAQTREQFDFSKKAPDEFAVVRRAPLEMPPDYTIRTPKPGAPRPQEASTDKMAREAILGSDGAPQAAMSGMSAGEAALLQKTGAANASPSIRAVVDKETAEIIEEETPGIATLQKMVGQKPAEPAPEVVDPVAETLRIKQNKAQGKPITEGKTPLKED